MYGKRQSNRTAAIVRVGVPALCPAMDAQANAALDVCLTLEGETQEVTEGGSSAVGQEGKIVVNGYSHKNGEGTSVLLELNNVVCASRPFPFSTAPAPDGSGRDGAAVGFDSAWLRAAGSRP